MTAGTYVCAHAYTPRAIERAVRCGVRSIEHGNYIDPPTAQAMAEKVGNDLFCVLCYKHARRRR